MPAVPFGACRPHAVPWCLVLAALSGGLATQSPPPFAPPRLSPCFNLYGAGAVLDLNRDSSPDLVVPSVFFGSLATTFDERGLALAAQFTGPSSAAGGSPFALPLAMAAGRFDADAHEDLVVVTTSGTVHFHRNLGSTRINAVNFAPDLLIEDFRPAWPINPPMQRYVFPAAAVVDFDGDGNNDVLLGGGPIDSWNGATMPGFIALYRGNGQGGFQINRYPVPGNIIDAQAADLDADGMLDHVVVLLETGAVGAFGYELVHLTWNGSQLVAGPSQTSIGSGRITALALADLLGDSNLDYVLAQLSNGGGSLQSDLICLPGNGQGNPQTSGWAQAVLPANQTGLSDFIPAVCAADFDGDGHCDLAVLRTYGTSATAAGVAATASPSDLLVAMGPTALASGATAITLVGSHLGGPSQNSQFHLLPLVGSPGLLRRVDLGGDGRPDLAVLGIRSPSPNTSLQLAMLRNLTPPAATAARCERLGEPSGGNAAVPARMGFEGGSPQPGNTSFACTLQNVPGTALAVLMWSPLGQADLMTSHGFTLHLAPAEFGFTYVTSGNQPANGFASYPLSIPPNPTLVGDAGWFQWFYYDPATATFGGSHATGLSIGS